MERKIINKILSAPIILFFIFTFVSCEKMENNTNGIDKKLQSSQQFVFATDSLKRYKFPTHINDLVIDRCQSQFSEAFMVVIEPEKAPPFHKHDDTEQVFYIIEGTGTLTIGDAKEKYKVKPGDVVRIPVSSYHSIQADKEKSLRYLCVDCFGSRPTSEPTWDDHVKAICRTNGWEYSKVVSDSKQ